MREIRQSGSVGGEPQLNAASLPQSNGITTNGITTRRFAGVRIVRYDDCRRAVLAAGRVDLESFMRRTRRGSLLVETSVAMVILTVALVAIAQTLGMVAQQRRESERRLWAMQAAANLMEHIAVQPFDQITAESVAELKLPEELQTALPGGSGLFCRTRVVNAPPLPAGRNPPTGGLTR